MYPFIDLATFPRRYGHRTGMLLAILFAGITYQSFVTDVLPRVPYMTCADKFVLLCLSASVSYTRVKSIQRLSVTILCHVAGVRSVRDVFSLQISHFCSLFLLPQVLDSRPRIYLVVRRTSCCKSRLDVSLTLIVVENSTKCGMFFSGTTESSF
eukprot:m.348243 g.348243  ORF g.348243 m.348243 type:complete len:154 (+) comp16562_c0_seq28:1386-1847(+)